MQEIELPILSWFIGETYKDYGNCYTGSIGATNLSANAFCYKVVLDRTGDSPRLVVQVYDVDSTINNGERHTSDFDVTDEGRLQAIDWIRTKYDEFVKSGKNKITIQL